jgi:hypothetical protein
MHARWKKPFAEGMTRRLLTFIPPPDWPITVTFSGSPPKVAVFS